MADTDKAAADTCRGDNWTPPADGAQCFEAALDEGSPEETCLHCGRHIRRHYGGTEYRCAPRDTLTLTPEDRARLDHLRSAYARLAAGCVYMGSGEDARWLIGIIDRLSTTPQVPEHASAGCAPEASTLTRQEALDMLRQHRAWNGRMSTHIERLNADLATAIRERDRARGALAALQALHDAQVPEWRPVTETEPAEGPRAVLALVRGYLWPRVVCRARDGLGWTEPGSLNSHEPGDVEAWMPLPMRPHPTQSERPGAVSPPTTDHVGDPTDMVAGFAERTREQCRDLTQAEVVEMLIRESWTSEQRRAASVFSIIVSIRCL